MKTGINVISQGTKFREVVYIEPSGGTNRKGKHAMRSITIHQVLKNKKWENKNEKF